MTRSPFSPTLSKPIKEEIRPSSEQELSDKALNEKIEKLMKFFDVHGVNYDKFVPPSRDFLDPNKKAYPNYEQLMYIPGQHDTQKWLMAVKDMYYKKKRGVPFQEVVRQVTSGWKKMETHDFLNWLRYYEEGTHMKYKFASVWYENGEPGYFLEVKQDALKSSDPVVDVDAAKEEAAKQEEKKQLIEKQRAKIIGRLDSAEKLLRSPSGQLFAGPEMEGLMEAIYSLKKKVQLVNKLSVSIRLYEDMIVRESNVLKRKGFVKAANLLYTVAQTPGADAVLAPDGQDTGGTMPPPSPPDDPSGAGHPGAPGNLPATIPGVPDINTPVGQDQNKDQPSALGLQPPAGPPGTAESSPAIMPQEEPQPAGIKEFMENMNDGNRTQDDEMEVTDNLEVEDQEQQLMVTEAQIAPPAPPSPPAATLEDVPMTDNPPPVPLNPVDPIPAIPTAAKPAPTPTEDEPLEVTEDDIPAQGDTPGTDAGNFDKQIDSAFKNVTLADVVSKLEEISTYYKTREHPRQLSVVDMMLDSLGLASMFPSLSEALNKSLEANNYISTRVDDILSKLRGAMVSTEKGLTRSGPNASTQDKPEVSNVKGQLQSDQEKEKKRKQMRKDQETVELEGPAKETPNVEMGELAPPAPPVAPRPLG